MPSSTLLALALTLAQAQEHVQPEVALRAALERLGAGDAATAQAELERVTAGERGFAWRHMALKVELARRPVQGVLAVTRLRAGEGALGPARFTPDGERLAAIGADGALHVWDARGGTLRAPIDAGANPDAAPAFSPSGGLVACGVLPASAGAFELDGGAARLTFRGHDGPVGPVAWSADGMRVATGSADRTLRVWEATSGILRWTASAHAAAVTAVDFDAEARHVLSASLDGTARVWDVRNGAQVAILRGGAGGVLCAAFDPIGARVATGHADHVVRVWEARTGALLAELAGHADRVRDLAWSPDARELATASADATARVWDVARKVELFTLAGHAGAVTGVAFAPDGTRLATSCADGTLRVFETDAAVARRVQGGGPVELPGLEAALAMKPLELDERLRAALVRPELHAATWKKVEELARANAERMPESGPVATTLGAALYRSGHAQEALDALVAAHELRRGWPSNLAFRALSLAALDRKDEARDWAKRLDVLLEEPRWQKNAEALALRDEVRRAVR